MNIICKIFGHRKPKELMLFHTGWTRSWNAYWDHHELAHHCDRCNKRVRVGLISTEKDGKLCLDKGSKG